MINTRLSKYLHNSESTCYQGPYSHLSEQHDLSIKSIAKSNFIYIHQVLLALKINSTHTPLHLSPRNQLSTFWFPLTSVLSLPWDGTTRLILLTTPNWPIRALSLLSSPIVSFFKNIFWLHNKWTRYSSPLPLKKINILHQFIAKVSA